MCPLLVAGETSWAAPILHIRPGLNGQPGLVRVVYVIMFLVLVEIWIRHVPCSWLAGRLGIVLAAEGESVLVFGDYEYPRQLCLFRKSMAHQCCD